MSGKIDSKQESQRSHLTSFTMKLKDKFHSPKIKRTPSNKKSKPPPEQPMKSPEKTVTKSLSQLEEHEKEVVSALRYFKTIIDKMAVDKKVLEMLPGSASKVLEAIMGLVQLDGKILSSSRVSSCLSRLYQSLANLIRWSDQVMLEGVNLEDKETIATVTTVIKAVLDGVKELVKVAIEKQEHPSPTTPVKNLLPASSPQRVPEPPVIESKETVLIETPTPAEAKETPNDVPDEEVAPPKPPLAGLKVPEHCPPALPPKKRQSAPSPTRIAVVAPMSRATSGSSLPIGICRQEYEAEALQRRFSGGSHSCGGESPRLSPCGSISILSKSDEQLSSLEQDSGRCSRNTSCETLDTAETYDPDYDFLHQDLSSIDQIPPANTGGCLSPLPESHNESSSFPVQPQSIPPALPKKERRPPPPQVDRLYSQYDNVSDEDMQTLSFPLFASMPPLNPDVFMGNFGPAENAQIPQSPPPLPEKKSRNILKYMQFMEDYSEPLPSVFYQTPQSESIYEQRNRKRFQEVYGLSDSFSSSDETVPPPALPPKQRQLDSSCDAEDSLQDSASEHSKDPADREGWKQKCVDSELSSEELYLMDHDEIMSHLTLKQENDDGPDVRAGSGDILLVHATETDRKDRVLYCEAFLTTYRTFLTPEDLIKKLSYRFTRFSLSSDINKQRASKNTFFVLVRAVDELCLVELTEDILKQLMELVFNLLCNGELTLARVLRKNILDKVQQKKLLQYTNSLKTLAGRGVAARPGTLHDFRSHEIADQLTLLDAELFYKIEIPEVLLWAKEQNEEKSPNLTQFTEHFNNMSYWVRSLIILQEKAQDREKLLLKFIKIMKHLRKLNNFNSYLAILSALDSAPIRRLEWQKQTSEGLEEYCTLIDSSSSFRAYRAALADVEPPCIPYLGLILQDLTFVHLGNPDLINGKINFSKRWQQFNILDTMRRFQQVHYDLKHNDDIVSFFNDFSDHLAEEALWELSLKIKPRNITRRKTEREERT
ncbi:rap guanine nucleotide exchange factor 1-like isoform X4 [Carassius carassius]|uniref:rap guanine nucleotide exchange factor 1-like isoform X4 n=1 Tax=Carassius carassius TaxID=217509 RepID=UPI0028691AD8|nr:rap guanine nucleotide exchange factor 1-like isoform X4 [Carassius carassius]